jgi:Zn-dependent protease
MFKGSIRVGRVAGIPIGIHPLWLVIVVLLTLSLGGGYYQTELAGAAPAWWYVLGLASALLLFASVLLHELGHALVARRAGLEIAEIDLWLLGGVAQMRGDPHSARDELRISAAGPAVSVALCGLFVALGAVVPGKAPDALLGYLALVNGLVAVFNLLPALPLDGGRIAHALLWPRLGSRDRATRVAAGLGQVFGWAFVVLGVMSTLAGAPGGLWLALIGGFLVVAARSEAWRAGVHQAVGGLHAADLMSSPAISIPAAITAGEAIRSHAGIEPHAAFPVLDAQGRVVGVVTLRRLAAVPAPERDSTLVGAITDRDEELLVDPRAEVTKVVERPAFARVGRVVVLAADRSPLGMLSITEIQRRMQAADVLGAGPTRPA